MPRASSLLLHSPKGRPAPGRVTRRWAHQLTQLLLSLAVVMAALSGGGLPRALAQKAPARPAQKAPQAKPAAPSTPATPDAAPAPPPAASTPVRPKGSAGQLVALADEIYRNSGARRQALEQYLQALEADPEHLRANYMAGLCYLQTIQKERSLAFLLRAYDINPDYEPGMAVGADLYPDLLYLLAQAYQIGENFDRAERYYTAFKKHIESGKGSRLARQAPAQTLRLTARRLYECQTGRQMKANPVPVKITPIEGVNSDFPDYAPAVSRDEQRLYFTSRRPGGLAGHVDQDLFYFEDIYVSERDSSGRFGPARLLPGVNTERHEATLSMSADGRMLLLYQDANGGDIYYATQGRTPGQWTRPKPLEGQVNSTFKESSAYLSSDGQRLFFSSDRPGGYGGLDIYVSYKQDGNKWGVPHNLGPTINTEYDDESPVISLDGRHLYFSSKGHRGMGGYDIFRASLDSTGQAWASPVNMGYPINTADNDLYYVQGNDLGHAYFASARESGTGDLDIYLIRPTDPTDSLLIRGPRIKPADLRLPALTDVSEVPGSAGLARQTEGGYGDTSQANLTRQFDQMDRPEGQTELRLRVVVVDRRTGRLLDCDLTFTDPETGKVYASKRLSTGVYLERLPSDRDREFLVSAERKGYQFRNISVRVKKGERGERLLERRLEMDPIDVNRPRVLRNIYFAFDRATLSKESYRELGLLENFLKQHPSAIIEVSGHTDFVGTDEYNQQLSQRRAQAVVSYLRGKGIAASRMRAKGYGKKMPLASNDDEREGRELNRRTEFEILGGI